MTKESLMQMGLTEQQAAEVMKALDGSYVTKARFNEVNEQLKAARDGSSQEVQQLRDAVADRDKQLATLKKAAGDNEELLKKIDTMQAEIKTKDETHAAELRRTQRDSVDSELLTAAGARNSKAVKALLVDVDDKVDLDAYRTERSKQLKTLTGAEDTKFLFQSPQRKLTGAKPGASGNEPADEKPDFSTMSYDELSAYMEANPDATLE